MFFFLLDGTFRDTWTPNGTINVRTDCGSHCEMYGSPPGEMPGESFEMDPCEVGLLNQPLGKVASCPPDKGRALATFWGYLHPMFIRVPVSHFTLVYSALLPPFTNLDRAWPALTNQGWYNFTFDAKTPEGQRIFCITAEVCLRWEDESKNEGYPKGPWSNCTWPR